MSTDIRTRLLALRAMVDEALADLAADGARGAVPTPLWMTPEEYAFHRGVSRETVYRWIKAGLPCERMGQRLVRISPTRGDEWHRAGGVDEGLRRDAEARARRAG